jgi:hypothetical protein
MDIIYASTTPAQVYPFGIIKKDDKRQNFAVFPRLIIHFRQTHITRIIVYIYQLHINREDQKHVV